MKDKEKSKERLIDELTALRQQITELKASETGPKRAEEELRESEEKHRTLFDTSPDGIIITTLDGKVLEANKAYQNMLGYTLRELKDMTYQQLTPEKWHKKEREAVKSFLSGKGYGYFEKEYIKKDGTIFPIFLTGWLIRDNQGNPEKIGVFVRDITERKQAEEVLKENEERFRDLFENANDLIQSVNASGEFVYVNKKWLETLGYSKEELGRLKLTDILREDQIPHCMQIFKKVCNGGSFEKVETVFISKDGSEIVVEGNVNAKIRDGRFIATRGIFRDITEQKKVEEAYRALVENSLQGLGIAQDNRVAFVNPTIAKMLGYTIEELMSFSPRDWKAAIHPEDQTFVWGRLQDRLKGKPVPRRYEFRMIRKDGKVIWVEIFSSHIEYNGKPAIQAAFVDITERKKAEEALKQSEGDYRGLFESAHDAIAVFDPDSEVVLDVNQRACDIYGLERDEFVGRSLTAISKDIERGKKHIKTTLDKGFYHHFETVQYRKDGSEMYLEINASVVDYKGKRAILSINRDITERKQAEEKLRSVEQEKAIILSSMAEHVVYQDKEMKVLWANRAAGQSVGRAPEELVGHRCYQIWQERSEPCPNCPIVEAVRTGGPHQAEMITADGRSWFIRGHPVRDEKGNITGAVEVTLEITERKKVEDTLRESEEKFRNLAEQSPNMIFLHKKGRVVYANKKCEEIMGYKTEEFYSPDFDFLKLISPESKDLIKANLERHMKGQEVAPLEYTLIAKGGRKIAAILTTKLIKYEGENAILGTVTDIRERKKMQEELLKARKLESVGILAGGIAHDFNNILTGILGNISLAKAEVDSKDEIFKTLTKAEKASLRAKDLTQQLLTFSKGGAPVRKTTSIAELIEDSVGFALRGSRVRCEFSMPSDLWAVELDEGQMNQVMNNLIINADQAMPEGGIIKVSAENVTLKKEDALPLKDGRYVKVTIEDQGIGIPRQHLTKIFDPYFSTKHKGDGLGLATSYSIIKNHRGYVAVDSELGRGASFYVYLPASSEKPPKKKSGRKTYLAGKGRILVMDDEEMVRDVVGDLLKILGYEVEFASDGLELTDLYRKAKDSGQPFDAVIMDLTVPGGMGGEESVRKLLEMDPEARAIVSSGYCNDPVMSNFEKYGFSGVVAKPFKIEELGEALHRVLMGTKKAPV